MVAKIKLPNHSLSLCGPAAETNIISRVCGTARPLDFDPWSDGHSRTPLWQLQSSGLACAFCHAANFHGSSACFIVRIYVESASDGVLMGNDKVLDSAVGQPLIRDRKKKPRFVSFVEQGRKKNTNAQFHGFVDEKEPLTHPSACLLLDVADTSDVVVSCWNPPVPLVNVCQSLTS